MRPLTPGSQRLSFGIAVTRVLRLNVNIPNVGLQGGTSPEAAFPNGLCSADDVIDKVITIINNNLSLGDNAFSS